MVSRAKKSGMPPGSLIYIGKEQAGPVKISLIDYDEKHVAEKDVESAADIKPFAESPSVTWVNIDGVYKPEIVEKLGDNFELHPLLLEDVLNTEARPKVEDYEKYLFFILKMISLDDKSGAIVVEQVSIVLGPTYVISFQERSGDVFNNVRERIRQGKGKVRKLGSDYLAYLLMDAVVDNYFVVLEKIGDRIEALESQLVKNPSPRTLQQIHTLKREMLGLRRAVWPLREIVSRLDHVDYALVRKGTRIYLRDVYDHIVQSIDTIETYREMVSGMIDIYLSSQSNRMNEVMKVLTVIATIFIPLTFITGLYGMNFDNMPELRWRYGYFYALGAMLIVALIMLAYFKRKKWM